MNSVQLQRQQQIQTLKRLLYGVRHNRAWFRKHGVLLKHNQADLRVIELRRKLKALEG